MLCRNPKQRLAGLVTFLVLFNTAGAFAQVVTGAITGRVTDTTGAVVPGAAIQIQNLDTGFSRSVPTDREGRYSAGNLPLGSYSVTAQQTGFRTEVRRGITLTVGSEVAVNLELSLGRMQETVEVREEAPAIETTSATVSGLVNPDQMRDLPLNGRSFGQLALLSAGVITNQAAQRNGSQGSGLRLAVNGARADMNLYLLDGTVVNDHSTHGPGSATGQNLGVEAIREFRVLTHNFSAEYGRSSGAVVSAVTRAGTNQLHGSAYEFVRNNIFDARNFFNIANAPAPSPLPPFRRNQFGASLGGPIRRDRIFFFVNYEGMRQRQGTTTIATVPDVAARQGTVPGQPGPIQVNQVIKPYLNLYPLPNTGRSFNDGTAEFARDFSNPATEDYSMQRLDFQISDKDSFYGRYVFNPSNTSSVALIPVFGELDRATNHFVVLSETHVFSATSLNEFRFGFNRTVPEALPIYNGTPPDPSLSFIPGQAFGTIQYTTGQGGTFGQLSSLGSSRVLPYSFPQNLFEGTDAFTTVRGAHSLKFGFDLERVQLNTLIGSNINGFFSFGGLLDLLAAKPTTFQALVLGPNSNPVRGWRRILFGWFIQDDYRIRPNLTLNLGFRHEFFTAPTEVNGRSANLRNLTDPQSTLGAPFQTPKTNFAPRFGLAWDPTGTGKMSLRAGVGVFHNHVDGRAFYWEAGQDSRFVGNFQISTPPFPYGLSNGIPSQLGDTRSMQWNLRTPTVIQYHVEVQRQLASSMSFRAGYVASHGYDLPGISSRNIRIAQIQTDGTKLFPATGPRINPNFNNIEYVGTDFRSNYNALQVVLQKNVSRGLQFQGSYTVGKALSDADVSTSGDSTAGGIVVMDVQDRKRDYGRSLYDQRQTFVFNSRYNMPWDSLLHSGIAKGLLGGWSVNGILSLGTGLTFNVQTGFNNSRNLDTNQPDRPNLAPGASNDPVRGTTAGCDSIVKAGQKLGTPDLYFDPCAFSLPPAGTFGNLARNSVTAPRQYNVDFTLVKSTPLPEKMNLEFRAEFFNLFNHPFFSIPNRTIFTSSRTRSGNAGRVTSTFNDGREIQFGLKLVF